ncbi:MAG: DUF5667 domain-containing protein [bacterium]|nr:DUF5667 domain-containing protein [bacterium]
MRRNAILSFAFLFVFLISVNSASADFRSRVLGAATVSPQIPTTSEGPGLVLPDSPFFFADNLKQNVRLMFAFAPEEKARVYEDIAGERLAELRFMLEKNNKAGVENSLKGVSENLQNAADQLKFAQLSGQNVSDFAQKLNDDIKLKQQYLDILEQEAQGELKAQVTSVQEGILVAKVKVEDVLPSDQLENEINYDLDRQVQRQVQQSSDLTKSIEQDLDELTKEASDAAGRSLKNREESLQKAIEEKNQALQKEHEKFLESEKQRNAKLMELESTEAKQAMGTVKKAQEAAVGYQNVRRSVQELKNMPAGIKVSPKITPTPSPIP